MSHSVSKVVMIIEMKMQVARQIHNVSIKDLLELLIYCRYIMEDDKLSEMCCVLCDVNTWHCLKVKANDSGKLQILQYTCYEAKNEEDLLGFLPSLVDSFGL